MKIDTHCYVLGPTYGKGSNPTGGEILIAPTDVVDPALFDLPWNSYHVGTGTLSQVVPAWNRRQAEAADDGVRRDWVYVYLRETQHYEGPFATPIDGGENPICRFFPAWETSLSGEVTE